MALKSFTSPKIYYLFLHPKLVTWAKRMLPSRFYDEEIKSLRSIMSNPRSKNRGVFQKTRERQLF